MEDKLKMVGAEKIKPYENNPRINDGAGKSGNARTNGR